MSRGRTNAAIVTQTDVVAGIKAANDELGIAVCEPELAGLSEKGIEYLSALAQFDGPTATADVAQAMGVTPQYANTYRRRLLDEHVLVEPKRGKVDFALPYLQTYLREHDVFGYE